MIVLVFVHPFVSSASPSSHYSLPTINPSIFFGTHVSLSNAVPPEQVHFGKTERQSAAHPIPSVLSPSSQTSGLFQLPLPQTAHKLKGFVMSQLELASFTHKLEHPSPLFVFPSSHSSGATLVLFPHVKMQGVLTTGQEYP